MLKRILFTALVIAAGSVAGAVLGFCLSRPSGTPISGRCQLVDKGVLVVGTVEQGMCGIPPDSGEFFAATAKASLGGMIGACVAGGCLFRRARSRRRLHLSDANP
jgi:hypothetical protein